MKDVIERIIEDVDIVQVISDADVELYRAYGDEWKARCPFHEERTPSFFVNTNSKVYHCFGCEAKGNVITFVKEYYGLDTNEAIHFLVERYAPHLKPYLESSSKFQAGSRPLLKYLYKKYIKGKQYPRDLLTYLVKERRLLPETIKRYAVVPYIKEEFERLDSRLKAQLRINQEKLWHKAILFPVFSRDKEVLGFIARNLGGNTPKYINSQGLDKNKYPYLWWQAFDEIRKNGDALIIVEGVIDALLVIQAGYRNVIASQGTSLPIEFLFQIKRYVSKIIFLPDRDSAGKYFLFRGIGRLINMGYDVYVYPKGSFFGKKDLGEVKEPDKIKHIIESVISYKEFFSLLIKKANTTEKAQKLESYFLETANSIKSEVLKEAFLKEFGINSNTRKKKTKLYTSPIVESIRRAIFDYLVKIDKPEAREFEPENYLETQALSDDFREYIEMETARMLALRDENKVSLLEYFKRHNLYKLRNDGLMKLVFSKIYAREPLVVSKDHLAQNNAR